MKEFVKKDMLYVKAYHKLNFVLALFFVLVSVFLNDSTFFAVYAVLMLSLISLSLINYDESEQFIYYALSIPKGREKLVASKYISNIIMSIGIVAVTALIYTTKLVGNEKSVEDVFQLLSMQIFASLLLPTFILPFNFAFGVKKGRLPSVLAAGLIFGATTVLGLEYGGGDLPDFMPLLIAIISLILYAGSFYISITIYKKKSF